MWGEKREVCGEEGKGWCVSGEKGCGCGKGVRVWKRCVSGEKGGEWGKGGGGEWRKGEGVSGEKEWEEKGRVCGEKGV